MILRYEDEKLSSIEGLYSRKTKRLEDELSRYETIYR